MKTRRVGLLGLGVLLLGAILFASSASGDIVLRMSFDDDGPENGAANEKYTPAKGDVIPVNAEINRLDGEDTPKTLPQIVKSTGFQGGNALQLVRPADGSNSGYYIKPMRYYDLPADGGITVETVIFVDGYDPGPSAGFAGILDSWGVGGIGPALMLVPGGENNPAIQFSLGWYGQSITYTPPTSLVGAWHHIAGVYTRSAGEGKSKIELFIDGVSVESKTFDQQSYQTFVPGGWSIGANATTAAKGRVLYGKMDAIAVTNDARTPATFVLPTKPKAEEPAAPQTPAPAPQPAP